MIARASYLATSALLLSAPVLSAQEFLCQMSTPCPSTGLCIPQMVSIKFKIDPNQFANAIDSKEPPRNKVTLVRLNNTEFKAEPIFMDNGTRGFWADQNGTDHLMTVQPDATASYTNSTENTPLNGYCEVSS